MDLKVTVLMSVYNGEKYLRQAVDSILNQTFNDFEFLIINDGSTDRTVEILQSYHDPRIKIINNEKNVGLTRSLNKGLKLAKGEYIARMDADDVSLPTRLERQISFLDRNKEVGLLGTGWYIIDENSQEMGISKVTDGKDAVHFMCHGTALIRKNCLEEVGLYREAFECTQDYDLWLRIADEFEVANLSKPLYKLREYRDSISSSKKLQQALYASLAIEMANERRKTGKDRLSIVDQRGAIRIRNQRLRVSGIKKDRILSHNYSRWSQAAFAVGEYKKSFNYAINALTLYILNCQAWSVLIRVIKVSATKFLTDKINNLHQRIIKKTYLIIPLVRKFYWNQRASDIDGKWGTEKHDYILLSKIISLVKPEHLLDLGCGSGRLFPLYSDLKIKEVIGQDISSKALKITKERYHFPNIKRINQDILEMNFPLQYFDLIVSNRVLQHIPRSDIEMVIKKLTDLGKNIYINEMFDSDYTGESFYMFKHDYAKLFSKYAFKVIQKGLLGRQTWFLFGKNIKESDEL